MSEAVTTQERAALLNLVGLAATLGFKIIPVSNLHAVTGCYGRVGIGDAFNVIEVSGNMTDGEKLSVIVHELAHIIGKIGEDTYSWDTEPIVDAATHLALEEAGLGYLRTGYNNLGYRDRSLRYDVYNKYSSLIDGVLTKLVPMLQYTHGGDQVSTGSNSV